MLCVILIEHSDQKQLGGGKRLFHLILPGHSLSWREVKAGTQGRKVHRELWRTADRWLAF